MKTQKQKISEETRKKLSDAKIGKKLSLETRLKIASSMTGKVKSEKTRRKIAESMRESRVNKKPFNTRLKPEIIDSFREECSRRRIKLVNATEEAMSNWINSKS